MGNCCSEGPDVVYLASVDLFDPNPSHKISGEALLAASRLSSAFSICQEVQRLLSTVAHSTEQVASLAAAIAGALSDLEEHEGSEDKEAVSQLFNENNVKLIKTEQLLYLDLEKQFLKKRPSARANHFNKSRIYHTIANFKKEKEISIKQTNQFGVNSLKSNGYKELSASQLEEVVRYEKIGEDILKLGDQLSFRYLSIKMKSECIIKMLSDCFAKYAEALSDLKYDLTEAEVMKVAKISREACQYYENGVYLLLVYFVQATKSFEEAGETSQSIEVLLNRAIELISQEYPPGKGLQEDQKYIYFVLNGLSEEKDWKKVDFTHQIQKLHPKGKQQQVEELIARYARTAQGNKELFEELVKATCLQKSVSFKIDLKYDPDYPKKKVMMRIKEKMFFSKEQQPQKRDLGGNVMQVLEREEKEFLRKIDHFLEKRESVQLGNSGMVRGKCAFLKVEDIIYAVNEIKRFVKADPRFGIAEIKSRFMNPVPTSDITLKIVINRQIVAKLHLTVQANIAAQNFSQKVYKLQRTKAFSKLKIIHNYFSELQREFRELASTAFNLLPPESPFKLQNGFDNSFLVKAFFCLDSVRPYSFYQALSFALENRQKGIPKIAQALDPNLQDLMRPLLRIQMGEWQKSIGSTINNVLQSPQVSPKLKGVLLCFFLKKFDLSKQCEMMRQFCLTEQQQNEGKRYMDEYLREYFCIDKAFEYLLEDHRIFQRGQQFLQLRFWKNQQKYIYPPIQLEINTFVQGVVGDRTEKISGLRQLLNLYFVIRRPKFSLFDQEDSFLPEFQYYYKWLSAMLRKNPQLDSRGMIANEAHFLRAQQLLEESQIEKAEDILIDMRAALKGNQQYDRALRCELLLNECFARGSADPSPDECITSNRKVKEQAEALGLQLRGTLVANSKWRITQYLWKKCKTREDKKKILETIASEALTQLSENCGKHFLYAMKQIWWAYAQYQIKEPTILENLSVTHEQPNGLGAAGCEQLSRAKWQNLTSLNLRQNSIGAVGCEHLSRAKWRNLRTLNLWKNQIRAAGCEHLSRAEWKNLANLNLQRNSIGDKGCEYLSQAKWNNLANLSLNYNQIEATGCEHLSRAEWNNLTILNIGNNQIPSKLHAFLRSRFKQSSLQIVF